MRVKRMSICLSLPPMTHKSRTAAQENGMSDNLSDYLTTRQAAELLGVAPDHVNRLLIAGKLKGQKVGHYWMVFRPSVETYRPPKEAGGRPRSGTPRIR